MSWSVLDATYQTRVLEGIRRLASEEVSDENLSNAYADAANELELWLNVEHSNDPFTEWLDSHKEELKSLVGKAVAIHLDKGIVADADVASFWDGSFHSNISTLFNNDPSVFVTIVPDGDTMSGVEAVDTVQK